MALCILLAERLYDLYPTILGQHLLSEVATEGMRPKDALGVFLVSPLVALPLCLVGILVRAALLPRYVRTQLSRTHEAKPPCPSFVCMLSIELGVSFVTLLAIALGGLPGALLAVALAGTTGFLPALVLVFVGVGVALGYVLPGVVFATRGCVFSGQSPREALRTSWSRARGRRTKILVIVGVAFVAELAGLMGYAALLVGALVTVPLARAFREALLTRVAWTIEAQAGALRQG
jgi:hypothetical protein